MSRGIEFRAWNPDKNEYGDLYGVRNGVATRIKYCDRDSPVVTVEGIGRFYKDWDIDVAEPNWILEQFTGLLDCNGVKIFEGDIVEVDIESQCSTHAVEWCDNDYPAFDLSPRIDCESNGLSFALNALGVSIMVIGNIHQNHELLA